MGGQPYDLRVDYFEGVMDARIAVSWSSPSTLKQIIPADALYPSDVIDDLVLLQKAALIIGNLKITSAKLNYLTTNSAKLGMLDFNQLPVIESTTPASLFTAWQQLVRLIGFRDALPAGEPAFFNILHEAVRVNVGDPVNIKNSAKQGYIETLSKRMTWSMADLEVLLGKKDDHTQTGFLAMSFPDDYTNGKFLQRLLACCRLMKRLGASAEQLRQWRKPDVTVNDVRSIKNTVKAKYDGQRWLEVAKPLKDQLREQQRAALVADLVAAKKLRDASDLYSEYLIDIEMSPCAITSRIKQAAASVQLFVQRCLMNLETDVSPSAIDPAQWKWMKNYRVWEANRKVFLYPENWIEPELRDDKSPFFTEFENELLQDDITDKTVETALLRYLEKLDQIARLEIVGMYHQKEDGIDYLHVFGRTFSNPHVYYYRRWVNSNYWTAWERVDLEIEGDHLIPVVWDRRLYLFWPVFTEKAIEPADPKNKPIKEWEIQLAWSEYSKGNWLAKRISQIKLEELLAKRITLFSSNPDKARFLFRVIQSDTKKIIRIYHIHNLPEHVPYHQGGIPLLDFEFVQDYNTVRVHPAGAKREHSLFLNVLLL